MWHVRIWNRQERKILCTLWKGGEVGINITKSFCKVRNDDRLTLDDVKTIDLLLAWWQQEQEAQK